MRGSLLWRGVGTARVRDLLRRATTAALRVPAAGWILVGAAIVLGFYVSAFEQRAYEICTVRAGDPAACRWPFSMR